MAARPPSPLFMERIMASERQSYRLDLQYPHQRGQSCIWSECGTYRSFDRAMAKTALQARPCRIVEYRVV
jgi:hypothetical protein